MIWTSLSGCFTKSPEDLFIAACDEILKERLKSPSSYKVISRTEITYEPLTVLWDMELGTENELNEYRKAAESTGPLPAILADRYGNKDADKIRSMATFMLGIADSRVKEGEKIASFYTKYEAANSFGASLAGAYKCEVSTPKDGLTFEPAASSIRVDGQTKLGWLISNMKRP